MEKIRRTLFFWTLVALFLIIAPLIVMSAWGYRFDFHRGVFVHSGTISLKTNPQDFNVNIDGQPENSKQLNRINNSYNISGLLPKDYDISLTADGFQSWTKKTEVHSGLSSEFWNVLLVRNNYNQLPLGASGVEKFFASPKNDFIAYAQATDAGVSANIFKISDKTVSSSFSFPGWQFIGDARKENIEWAPEEDHISVPLKKTVPSNNKKIAATDQFAYFIADPADNSSFNLNEFVGKADISAVRWDPQDKNYLFFLSQNSLYRANISDNTDLTMIAENVSSYDLSKSGIYYAQMPNELVFKTSLDGKSDRAQITFDFPEELSSANDRLIVYDDDRIAFLNKNKELFIYNKGEQGSYFRKLGDSIEGIQFSDDGKKLLFWSNNEISVYFLRPWNVQPTRNEDEVQTITRYADQLKNIQWFKDYEHVIFSTGPYVKIIELDGRDHRNCMDLLKTATDSPVITYNNYLERLFFTDTKDNSSDLNYIIFPEPVGFLGIFPPIQQQ